MQREILVDSNIFIGYLNAGEDPARELTQHLQMSDLFTCGMVRVEVIRGLRSPKARQRMEGFLNIMRNVFTDNKLWEEATELAWQCARMGINAPNPDFLIAASAIRANVAILTLDKHFDAIPGIQVFKSLDEL
jgi:predicted nucleic acid-binding protein